MKEIFKFFIEKANFIKRKKQKKQEDAIAQAKNMSKVMVEGREKTKQEFLNKLLEKIDKLEKTIEEEKNNER